jgi:hypothetical protein
VSPELTVGSTVAGDKVGLASATRFTTPSDVAVFDGAAFVADLQNNRIAKVSLLDGDSSELLSTGTTTNDRPSSIAVCDDGVGYVGARTGLHTFDAKTSTPTFPTALPPTLALWVTASYYHGGGLACFDNSTDSLLFAIQTAGSGIRAYDRSNRQVVWEITTAQLEGVTPVKIALSPDHRHLAFSAYTQNKVGCALSLMIMLLSTISKSLTSALLLAGRLHQHRDQASDLVRLRHPGHNRRHSRQRTILSAIRGDMDRRWARHRGQSVRQFRGLAPHRVRDWLCCKQVRAVFVSCVVCVCAMTCVLSVCCCGLSA